MNQRALELSALAMLKWMHGQQAKFEHFAPGIKSGLLEQAQECITAYEAHLKAEGFVVVPTETFFEIANRAGNMSDPDAADWLPSIYRIAMEAAGEDLWPTLRLHGYDPDNLSASFDTMAKNGEARAAAQEPNDADK